MRIRNINVELLQKKTAKLAKKAILGVVMFSTLVGCSVKTNTGERVAGKETDIFRDNVDNVYVTDTEENKAEIEDKIEFVSDTIKVDTPISHRDDEIRDVSDDYRSVFIGDTTDGVISAASGSFVYYKDSSNAFTRGKSGVEDATVTLDEDAYYEFNEFLDEQTVDIPYGDLFNIEHLFERQSSKNVDHSKSIELVNGRVDETELYNLVKTNNQNYDYPYTFTDLELKTICSYVANAANYTLDNNEFVDTEALSCNLGNLKIFKEDNITNARVTDDMVLGISPDMIKNLQSKIGDLDALGLTSIHETGHLAQMACDDEIDRSKGNKIGFAERWEDEPVNSLFWSWYYEASAESMMSNATGAPNIVYENPISYLKYLKLVMALRPDFEKEALENVSVSRNYEDFYRLFGFSEKSEMVEFAKLMYAIDLIQNENADFEKVYMQYTGSNSMNTDEWVKVKRQLKSAIAVNLSVMYYRNLANQIKNGGLTLNDAYYLITVFEAEIELHNTYDSLNKFETNETFMASYIDIQNAFFASVKAAAYGYDDIVEGFNNYSFEDGYTLANLSEDAKSFICAREEELISSTTTNIRTFYDTLTKQYGKDRALGLN